MLVSYYLPGTSLAHPKIHGATFISDDLVHGSLLHIQVISLDIHHIGQ